ncbi:hypothetical protein ABIE64_002223 [Thalassospira sp. MBR-102]|jgi:hypothetical protein|uniref:hypothetical protein n=1 Tax=Thalassospira sp. MBR-102 TaxID=3156466 RepID=UPI003399ED92
MNINAEKLEAVVNTTIRNIHNHGAIEGRALLGLIGDLQVQLVVTWDDENLMDDTDPVTAQNICITSIEGGNGYAD